MKKCKKCGYIFMNRVESPRCCPSCKKYNCIGDLDDEDYYK